MAADDQAKVKVRQHLYRQELDSQLQFQANKQAYARSEDQTLNRQMLDFQTKKDQEKITIEESKKAKVRELTEMHIHASASDKRRIEE